MYDIAIIGLGPAGATLARLLNKKYKVMVIDRKNDRISKCCGGLLSPDAQKILAQFDLCLPKDVLADPQIFSVQTIDFDNNLERFYQRFYVNMNRAKFDNFLIALLPGHIEICKDSVCTKIEREQNAYNLEIKTQGVKRTVQSRIIIGADGANSIVRNTFYKKNNIRKYTAIQEWYDDKKNSPFYSCIFDKTITDSYCWTISKDHYFMIGGAFLTKNGNEKFEILKEKIKKRGVAFDKLIKREACFVYLNKGVMSTCTGKNGAYLLGEAAGMISPSSLEGISYAMESARILAGIINEDVDTIGYRYFLRTLGMRIALLLKILKMPFMYNRILRGIIMKMGIKAIKKNGK